MKTILVLDENNNFKALFSVPECLWLKRLIKQEVFIKGTFQYISLADFELKHYQENMSSGLFAFLECQPPTTKIGYIFKETINFELNFEEVL